ncbi:MAG: hypothetical protein IKL85_06330, partial [Lentisphaeria bacterium]|nr:hypothetical protein [Lentisphaeria bacterium]
RRDVLPAVRVRIEGLFLFASAFDKHTLCQNAAGDIPASNPLSHVRRFSCVMRHSVPSSCQSVPSTPFLSLFSNFFSTFLSFSAKISAVSPLNNME